MANHEELVKVLNELQSVSCYYGNIITRITIQVWLTFLKDISRGYCVYHVMWRLQAMKTYHQYHAESLQAEQKLNQANNSKSRLEQSNSKSTFTNKKVKGLTKQVEKV